MTFWTALTGRGTDQSNLSDASTVVSMVIATAGLASNTAAVDPYLDTVRSITARLVPGEQPSRSDEDKLLDVYEHLEAYLITQDPLRHFSKTELRRRLSPALYDRLQQYETKGGSHD